MTQWCLNWCLFCSHACLQLYHLLRLTLFSDNLFIRSYWFSLWHSLPFVVTVNKFLSYSGGHYVASKVYLWFSLVYDFKNFLAIFLLIKYPFIIMFDLYVCSSVLMKKQKKTLVLPYVHLCVCFTLLGGVYIIDIHQHYVYFFPYKRKFFT